jgi:hypothetical protein
MMPDERTERMLRVGEHLAAALRRSIARNGRLVEVVNSAINLLEENGHPVEAALVRSALVSIDSE